MDSFFGGDEGPALSLSPPPQPATVSATSGITALPARNVINLLRVMLLLQMGRDALTQGSPRNWPLSSALPLRSRALRRAVE